MSETEKMVPFSQAARMLTTGFEWEAGLFIETYKILTSILSKEEAKEILGKAMYRAGLKLGEEARGLVDRGDVVGMAQAWDVIYGMGTEAAERLDDERFIIRGQNCAAFNLFRRWGVSDQEIRDFCDAYCAGDMGHAEGFGGKVHFQHTSRLMRGDDCCVWDFSMEPQMPHAAAVPKDNLLDEVK
jgi:L-2-amino-thiazoline-4-carboxylic acid hydrolase